MKYFILFVLFAFIFACNWVESNSSEKPSEEEINPSQKEVSDIFNTTKPASKNILKKKNFEVFDENGKKYFSNIYGMYSLSIPNNNEMKEIIWSNFSPEKPTRWSDTLEFYYDKRTSEHSIRIENSWFKEEDFTKFVDSEMLWYKDSPTFIMENVDFQWYNAYKVTIKGYTWERSHLEMLFVELPQKQYLKIEFSYLDSVDEFILQQFRDIITSIKMKQK